MFNEKTGGVEKRREKKREERRKKQARVPYCAFLWSHCLKMVLGIDPHVSEWTSLPVLVTAASCTHTTGSQVDKGRMNKEARLHCYKSLCHLPALEKHIELIFLCMLWNRESILFLPLYCLGIIFLKSPWPLLHNVPIKNQVSTYVLVYLHSKKHSVPPSLCLAFC